MSVSKRKLKSGKESWQYSIELGRNIFGKRLQEKKSGFATKKDARAAERSRLNEIENNACAIKKLTFTHACELYMQNARLHYAGNTLDKYEHYVKDYFNVFESYYFSDIRIDLINKWKIQMLEQEKSPSVINDCLKLLKAIGNYLCTNEYVFRNPFENAQKISIPAKEIKVFNLRQVTRMLRRAERDYPRLYPLLYTALFTGMRQGELLGLKWSDINFEKRVLYVRRQFTNGKLSDTLKTTGSRRTIDLEAGLINCLLEYKKTVNPKHELVFCTNLGTPLLKENIRRRWYYPLLESFKWRGYRFHDLRHTYASMMLSHGISYLYVSKQMGHSKPTTTLDIYAHFIPDINDHSVDLIGDKFRRVHTEREERMNKRFYRSA